jgi:hypothetical protein
MADKSVLEMVVGTDSETAGERVVSSVLRTAARWVAWTEDRMAVWTAVGKGDWMAAQTDSATAGCWVG